MKAPAFQFYAGDFLVGTAMMTAEEVGGYIRLLCYQWTQGSIPDDDATIMRLAGCSGNAVASIRHKFGINPAGRLVNQRLEQVRAEREEFCKAQAEKAAKGWEKRKNHGSAMPQQCKANAVAMPKHMPNRCQNDALQSSVFGLQSSGSEVSNTCAGADAADAKDDKPEQPKERKRDPIFDAIAESFGYVGEGGKVAATVGGMIAKARKELVGTFGAAVTPEEIRKRTANLKARFDNPTPVALVKHWNQCATTGGALDSIPENLIF